MRSQISPVCWSFGVRSLTTFGGARDGIWHDVGGREASVAVVSIQFLGAKKPLRNVVLGDIEKFGGGVEDGGLGVEGMAGGSAST